MKIAIFFLLIFVVSFVVGFFQGDDPPARVRPAAQTLDVSHFQEDV